MRCHSGGCPGADIVWEMLLKQHEVPTYAYSFKGHVHEGEHPIILTQDELDEGWGHVKRANETLNRNVESLQNPYVRNLMCRNWFQVKNSEAVFAVGTFINQSDKVNGGTGWAVQMAIDSKRPTYVYDQMRGEWFSFNHKKNIFEFLSTQTLLPAFPDNFAGIGTREINDAGIEAINRIIEVNLNQYANVVKMIKVL